MPQLDPNPWFLTLMASWVIFVTLGPPKIMKHLFNNEPEAASTQKPMTTAWDWLWH